MPKLLCLYRTGHCQAHLQLIPWTQTEQSPVTAGLSQRQIITDTAHGWRLCQSQSVLVLSTVKKPPHFK